MICNRCGKTGKVQDFTRMNVSRDGRRAVCKDCVAEANKKARVKTKKERKELAFFELKPSLLTDRAKPRIGVLILHKYTDRKTTKDEINSNIGNVGMQVILRELREPWEYCPAVSVNQYEYVLVSLMSVMDVENIIYTMEMYGPQERTCKVIVGGFGVVNINLIIPYIDVAVFGRAEGQINGIIEGRSYKNVWRKAYDPDREGAYEIRQPKYLVHGERSVGCRYSCSYCHYTHVRRPIDEQCLYDPGMQTQETDWNGLEVDKPGRYVTAWDGWSDVTRRRVHKPVTNSTIISKLFAIDALGLAKTVTLKIFQIVGYPWETIDSVRMDMSAVSDMLQWLDSEMSSSINLAFLCTPFGPEPLTPMQSEGVDIKANWKSLTSVEMYKGKHIKAYIMPFISGQFMLLKRLMINRANKGDLNEFKSVVFSRELLKHTDTLRVQWLSNHRPDILRYAERGYNADAHGLTAEHVTEQQVLAI